MPSIDLANPGLRLQAGDQTITTIAQELHARTTSTRRLSEESQAGLRTRPSPAEDRRWMLGHRGQRSETVDNRRVAKHQRVAEVSNIHEPRRLSVSDLRAFHATHCAVDRLFLAPGTGSDLSKGDLSRWEGDWSSRARCDDYGGDVLRGFPSPKSWCLGGHQSSAGWSFNVYHISISVQLCIWQPPYSIPFQVREVRHSPPPSPTTPSQENLEIRTYLPPIMRLGG